jgi:signal transduction histidine kinase
MIATPAPLTLTSDPDALAARRGPLPAQPSGREMDRAVGERAAAMARAGDVAWVAARLAARRDEILERWLDAAAEQPFHAGRREHAVADNIPNLFDALVALLRRHAPPGAPGAVTGSALDDPAVLKAAHEHARARLDEGLDASDVLTEFRLLRQELGRSLRLHLGPAVDAGPASAVLGDVLAAQLLVNDALDSAALLALSALGQREAELREHMRHAQEREAFLASVTHDLKNPLAAIKGMVQILQRQATRGTVSPDGLLERLRRIDDSAGRMAAQLNELMDVVRLRSGERLELKRAPLDLVALARRAAAAHQASTESHTIRVETDLESLTGEWDAARLERVLDNLIGNAVKFSPRGGTVTIEVRREIGTIQPPPARRRRSPRPGSGAARRATPAGPVAVLRVSDQGVGIPAADLPHVFGWFRRAGNVTGKIAGTGIGLATARQVVEQHGGAITAESAEGTGSTFTVRLPLDER